MDITVAMVWETEGRRGAAERGWLGEHEREDEIRRQQREAAAATDGADPWDASDGADPWEAPA